MLKGCCSRQTRTAHVVLILYHKSGWMLKKTKTLISDFISVLLMGNADSVLDVSHHVGHGTF